MKKSKRAKFIQAILEQFFPDPQPPLFYKDHYTLLIAVLLSARSTDAQVNKVTPKLFSLASSPEEMVLMDVETIRGIIKPCGLSPTKAKNIVTLSQILLEKYGGKVPNTFEELESLPGVGHKTASIVMAQGFHVPAFPVDTHIHRCAKRWGLSEGKNVVQVERDLKGLFKNSDWIKLHLQIIYFARAYCPARAHKVDQCPICSRLSKEEAIGKRNRRSKK